MNRSISNRLALATTIAFLSTAAFAHDDATLDKMKSPHDGQLRMSGVHHLELVIAKDSKESKDHSVAVYLTDHAGTKISTAGVQGTAIILTGKTKVVVPLTAAGDNKLSGTGKYASVPGTKVVVSLTLADKTTEQARFTPSTAAPMDDHKDHQH